jgi:dipicolinate synthase subunit B
MAVKSHLRGGKPVVLAFGSNDGLGASAKNIGELLNRKHIYFVPMYQDDPRGKPRSLASDYARLEETILAAYEGRQPEPIFECPK